LTAKFDSQEGVECIDRLLLHGRCDVGVPIEGDADLGVAKHLCHDLGVYPLAEEERRRRVPQVVEADPVESSPVEDFGEGPADDVDASHNNEVLEVRMPCALGRRGNAPTHLIPRHLTTDDTPRQAGDLRASCARHVDAGVVSSRSRSRPLLEPLL
jgi:hypothetical protein